MVGTVVAVVDTEVSDTISLNMVIIKRKNNAMKNKLSTRVRQWQKKLMKCLQIDNFKEKNPKKRKD